MTNARGLAWLLLAIALAAAPCAAAAAAAEEPGGAATPGDAPPQTKSLVDFIKAGKNFGYAILFLSFVGMALVIDCFMRITRSALVPPSLARQVVSLARQAQIAELVRVSRESDSLLGRILGRVMSQRPLSLASARESLREECSKETARLQHRVEYIGLLATIAPILGLLGTAVGVIGSLDALGAPEQGPPPAGLAAGISEALVTTCEGLIVAIPLMFFQLHFRIRVTRIGQDAAGVCDSVMRSMAAVVQARTTGRPARHDLETAAPGKQESADAAEYEIQGDGLDTFNPADLTEEDDLPRA
jgi:biopolymer transport protein ExbB